MKALSLHEPWASLVKEGRKTIETRSWQTRYRGPLAIHASQTLKSVEYLGWMEEHQGEPEPALEPFADRLTFAHSDRGLVTVADHPFALGAVVATCELVDVVPIITNPAGALPVDRFVYCDGDWLQVHDGPLDSAPRYSDTEHLYGDYREGRYAWLLDNITPIDPMPAKGRQGLFEVCPG